MNSRLAPWSRVAGAVALVAALAPQLASAGDAVRHPIAWEADPRASGGYGDVYRGVDGDGRYVAAKTIKRGTADNERWALERMRGTPGFPMLLETTKSRHGYDVVIMKWLWGETLEEHPRLSLDRALTLGDSLLQVVARMHRKGLVHQDIKPSNVMLDNLLGDDSLTLLDLGQAMKARTLWNGRSGSLDYRAPEQDFAGVRTPATDVYGAAGVMVYLATGRPPFPRAAELAENFDFAELSAHRERRTIAKRIAHGPVRAVLLKALSPAPTDRYQTVAAFRRALRTARAGAPALR